MLQDAFTSTVILLNFTQCQRGHFASWNATATALLCVYHATRAFVLCSQLAQFERHEQWEADRKPRLMLRGVYSWITDSPEHWAVLQSKGNGEKMYVLCGRCSVMQYHSWHLLWAYFCALVFFRAAGKKARQELLYQSTVAYWYCRIRRVASSLNIKSAYYFRPSGDISRQLSSFAETTTLS